jgi:hypothetical protein
MRNVNDVVFVPADSFVAALLASAGMRRALTLVARRVYWTESIDHAVTTGTVFIGPAPVTATGSGVPENDTAVDGAAPAGIAAAPVRRGRPLKLPANLLERTHVLKVAAAQFCLICARAPAHANASIDELNARLVNAIKAAHTAAVETVFGEGGSKDCEPAAVRSARDAAAAALRALKQLTSAGVRSGVELTQADRTARHAAQLLAHDSGESARQGRACRGPLFTAASSE